MVKGYLAAVIIIVIAAVLYFTPPEAYICEGTEMSEAYYNLIDDDCDGLVDEDFVQAECGNGIVEFSEFCDDGNQVTGDGCSSGCKNESLARLYVAPYVGNIDGGFDEDWYYVFEMFTDFHTRNGISAGFSIYPVSIKTGAFGKVFKKIYESPYIEFIQKGYRANEREMLMNTLSFHEQVEIVKAGQDRFRRMAEKILNTTEVQVPLAYNHPQARLTDSIRDALWSLGFKIFFDLYLQPGMEPVNSTEDFDVVQYGSEITRGGGAGRHTEFRPVDELIEEIKSYVRHDVNMVFIGDKRVVPVWLHQYDIEDSVVDNAVNQTKWRIYTELLLRLKQDPEIIMIRPLEIYGLRHGGME